MDGPLLLKTYGRSLYDSHLLLHRHGRKVAFMYTLSSVMYAVEIRRILRGFGVIAIRTVVINDERDRDSSV